MVALEKLLSMIGLKIEKEYRAVTAPPYGADYSEAEEQMFKNRIRSKDKYVVDFLMQCDACGYISRVQCMHLKKLLLKDQHRNENCGEMGYEKDRFTVDDIIDMLRDGIRTKKGLTWR